MALRSLISCSLLLLTASAVYAAPPRKITRRIADVPHFKWVPNAPKKHAIRSLSKIILQRAKRQPKVLTKRRKRAAERLAKRYLRRYGRIDAKLVRQKLPALPKLPAELTALLPLEYTLQSNTQRYLYLERQVAVLRGSSAAVDRDKGVRLNTLLKSYKASWADRFLDSVEGRFERAAKAMPRRKVTFRDFGISSRAKLPLLPAATNPEVQRLITSLLGAKSGNTARGLYVALEREHDRLERAGSGSAPLANALNDYLLVYRQGWKGAGALPPLPRTQNAKLQREVIDVGLRRTKSPEQLYRFLEGRLIVLQQDRSQGKLAGQLGHYLAGYKKQLKRDAVKNIDQALKTLQGVVHPKVLARLPRLEFQVGFTFPGAGIIQDGNQRLVGLTPPSSLKDVLHEVGHMFEFYGKPDVIAAAQSLRAMRADGSHPVPLSKLLPNTTYGSTIRAFKGSYVDNYIGRRYGDGYTEAISMGMERFASRAAAKKFFMEDGHHLLVMLSALQKPGAPVKRTTPKPGTAR